MRKIAANPIRNALRRLAAQRSRRERDSTAKVQRCEASVSAGCTVHLPEHPKAKPTAATSMVSSLVRLFRPGVRLPRYWQRRAS